MTIKTSLKTENISHIHICVYTEIPKSHIASEMSIVFDFDSV